MNSNAPHTSLQRTLTRGGSAVASPHHQRATDGLDWGPALGRISLLAGRAAL